MREVTLIEQHNNKILESASGQTFRASFSPILQHRRSGAGIDNGAAIPHSHYQGVESKNVSVQFPASNFLGADASRERIDSPQTDDNAPVEAGVNTSPLAEEEVHIHTSGMIQAYGMLVALDEDDENNFKARIASENSRAVCSYSPADLFKMDDFCGVFPGDKRSDFALQAETILRRFRRFPKLTEPRIFPVRFIDSGGTAIPCWCAMHCVGRSKPLLICEFELQNYPQIGLATPPEDNVTLSDAQEASAKEDAETQNGNIQSLEPILDVRGLFGEDAVATETLSVVSQIQHTLSSASSVRDLLHDSVRILQELTQIDRCMVYELDESFNATVAAEVVTPHVDREPYIGLHFPAVDVVKQAHDLLEGSRIQSLFDQKQKPIRLLCRSDNDRTLPLDLTSAYLKAVAADNMDYLGRMAVCSTMIAPIRAQEKLWGMICCFSYDPAGTRISFPVRELCYWLSLCASSCLDKLLNIIILKAHELHDTVQLDKTPDAFITASSEELLRLFQADFGFLTVDGEARTVGKLGSYQEAVILLRYMSFKGYDDIFATQNVLTGCADLHYAPKFRHIAGLLYIPLSATASDFILLFRKAERKEIRWASDPTVVLSELGKPQITLRKWTESVQGTCSEWTRDQREPT